MHLKKLAIAAGAISLTNLSAAKADIEVITSIKPVHSLVSGVMAGVGNPSVIIEGAVRPIPIRLNHRRQNNFKMPNWCFGWVTN